MLTEPKRLDAVSVGDAIVDIVSLVDQPPALDEEVEIHELETHGGGAAANTAVGLARLGLRAGFVGAVGNDAYGRFLLEAFDSDMVDRSMVKVVNDRSGLAYAFVVRSTGERILFCYRGANMAFSPSEIDLDYIEKAEAVEMSGTKLDVAETIAEHAQRHHRLVYYDPGSITASKGMGFVRELILHVNVLAVNPIEAKALVPGLPFEEAAKKLLECGPQLVIVKLGEEGCYVRSRTEEFRASAFKVKAIDATGAGDAFNAAFVYSLLKKFSLKEAIVFSTAAAALKVTRRGARGMATLDEVTKFLRAHDIHCVNELHDKTPGDLPLFKEAAKNSPQISSSSHLQEACPT
jgi:ribokinase